MKQKLLEVKFHFHNKKDKKLNKMFLVIQRFYDVIKYFVFELYYDKKNKESDVNKQGNSLPKDLQTFQITPSNVCFLV